MPPRLDVSMVADQDIFASMAKLRAARLLIGRIEEACGLAPAPIRLHAETSWRMTTRLDPWSDMIRATLAGFAAGLAVSNGVLFWVRGGQAGSIQAAPLGADAGAGAAGIGANVTGLAADGEDLYFIAEERRIQHTRRGSSTIETLFETDTPFGPGDVAVDPEAVYWTEPKTGRVRKTAR